MKTSPVYDMRVKSEKDELKRDVYNDIDSIKNLLSGLNVRETEYRKDRNLLYRNIQMSDKFYSEKKVYTLGYGILSKIMDIEEKVKAM